MGEDGVTSIQDLLTIRHLNIVKRHPRTPDFFLVQLHFPKLLRSEHDGIAVGIVSTARILSSRQPEAVLRRGVVPLGLKLLRRDCLHVCELVLHTRDDWQ